MNPKFTYIDRHLKTQRTSVYIDITRQKFILKQQVLKDLLSLVTIAPDEMAYTLMKQPGYMPVITAEVIYIIQCNSIQVKIRQTEECYRKLPISYRNNSYFRAHYLKGSITEGLQ